MDVYESLFLGSKLSMTKIPWEQIESKLEAEEIANAESNDQVEKEICILNMWLGKNPKFKYLFVNETHTYRSKKHVYLSFILENTEKEIKLDPLYSLGNRTRYGLKEFQSILSTINVEVFQTALEMLNQDITEPRFYIDHDYA